MTSKEFNMLQAGTSERDQQEALVEWARYKRGEIPALWMLLHIPMGGHRTAKAGARMKRLGARKGVPDLLLPYMAPRPNGGVYGSLWIEMKSSKGRLRKEQRWWRDRLIEQGFAWSLARSWIEGRDTIEAYLDGRFNQDQT